MRHGASDRVVTRRGQPLPDTTGAPVLTEDSGREQFGTGRGTGSVVWYTRGYFPTSPRAPVPAEEYLFHELVHAFANMQGMQDNRLAPRGVDFDFHTLGEFWAILLTNMYRSEAGVHFRRWDHHPTDHHHRVDRAYDRSTRGHPRVELERQMVREMWRVWWGRDRGLLSSLRSLDLEHNPLRDYLTPNPRHIPERGCRS